MSEVELPEGWAEATIGDLIEFGPRNICDGEAEVGFIPMPLLGTRFRDMPKFERRSWKDVKSGYSHFRDGDVLLARITPCFENGKAGIPQGLPNGIGAGSTEYFVCRCLPNLLVGEYLLGHFKLPTFLDAGRQAMGGAVGHQRVPKEHVTGQPISLPPFAEQKRIAQKLDGMIGRIDACRERLDRIPGIIKRFRQSVLSAACSGQLTSDWREARSEAGYVDSVDVLVDLGVSVDVPTTWRICRVGDVCTVRLGGTPSRSEISYWNGDIPWVSSGEVANNRITRTRECITDVGIANSNAKVYPVGTVLIAMIGEGKTRGQSAILEIEAATNQNVAALVFDRPGLVPLYAWYWALSQYEQTRNEGRGGNQPALNGAKVTELIIPIPPMAEQHEIIRRVDALFSLGARLEARYYVARAAVERLTPSLLAKAFRGELVPQDPNDEPASVLLERIRAQRAAESQASKRGRGRRAVGQLELTE